MSVTLDEARALDRGDPLSAYREDFYRVDDPIAYLDGNSLGRPPKATLARLDHLMKVEWGERLIRSWEERWVDLPITVGDRLGDLVLGASAGQTAIADSTTVNLYKVLHAACGLRPGRTEIVVDRANFPTDRYIVESVAKSRGMIVRWIEPDLIMGVSSEDLAEVVSARTAAVVLSQVDYRSGALLDLGGMTAQVQDSGALMIWDLCHSAGVIPIKLDVANVDFAVGCTYKYLNAGPGAPAFLYVATRHLADATQPIQGWWSAENLFAMSDTYVPATSIRKMLSGTANVPGITAVDASLDLIQQAGIEAIHSKAVDLTGLCIELADAWLADLGMLVVSPRDSAFRGGHVTLSSPRSREISRAMSVAGVVPDFREPDLIRLGLSPLTTSFEEVWTAMSITRSVIAERSVNA